MFFCFLLILNNVYALSYPASYLADMNSPRQFRERPDKCSEEGVDKECIRKCLDSFVFAMEDQATIYPENRKELTLCKSKKMALKFSYLKIQIFFTSQDKCQTAECARV